MQKSLYTKYIRYIGIDPGVNTGIAVWNTTQEIFEYVATLHIINAFNMVKTYAHESSLQVWVEDARLRTWFGYAGREQLQGAGSIKRDCQIWQTFLENEKIPFRLIAPRNIKTKLNAAQFNKITGYKNRTNQHDRDAAMIVFGI